MAAYYNENDPKAAAWLRELIKANAIAPGEVDDRDIRDIRPNELAGFTQCHFFAGIGVWSYALRLAGWSDERPVWTGSCPCQPFSAAGKGKGTADERHLWPSWFHLIEICKPPVIFGEQVASPAGLGWFDTVHADMERTGYAIGAADLCAAGVGAPHIRQRLYFVAESDRVQPEQSAWSRTGSAETQSGRTCSESAGSGDARELADNARDGRREECADDRGITTRDQTQRLSARSESGSSDSGLAHDDEAGRGIERRRGILDEVGTPQRNDIDGRSELGNADIQGSQRWRVSGGRCSRERSAWTPSDFIWCRDGKWRPVEPGTFPLAHGAPARVGRLRGYGNAIVAPLAAAFIETYTEI